jgi:hypothetical protein
MGTQVCTDQHDTAIEHAPPTSAATPKTASRSTDRSLIARQGAYTLHALYDSRELTQPGRDKFLARFVDEVDPNRELPEHERLRRAESLKKAYFTALARKSAAARSKRQPAS